MIIDLAIFLTIQPFQRQPLCQIRPAYSLYLLDSVTVCIFNYCNENIKYNIRYTIAKRSCDSTYFAGSLST
jgi:hypothetical protein